MFIEPIEISDDPYHAYKSTITGEATYYKRKVVVPRTLDRFPLEGIKEFIVYAYVKCYDDLDIERPNPRGNGSIELKVNNTTPVDANGDYVLDANGNPDFNNPSVVSGEYDYLLAAIKTVVAPDLITKGIKRADSPYRRFDV